MGTRHRIELTVNGALRTCETAGRTSLADLLRDELRRPGQPRGPAVPRPSSCRAGRSGLAW